MRVRFGESDVALRYSGDGYRAAIGETEAALRILSIDAATRAS